MKWYESLLLAVAFSVVFAGTVSTFAPDRLYDVLLVLEILIAVVALYSVIDLGKKIWKKVGRKPGP